MIANYSMHLLNATCNPPVKSSLPSAALIISVDPKTGRQPTALEGARMILDGRLGKALTDRTVPSVTPLGKAVDYLIDRLFKRSLKQSENNPPLPAPQESDPIPLAQPISPLDVPLNFPIQMCSPSIFDEDLNFGTIYLQTEVSLAYNCQCVNDHSQIPDNDLKGYYKTEAYYGSKIFQFRAKNMTLNFIGQRLLPQGLVDNIDKFATPIITSISTQCLNQQSPTSEDKLPDGILYGLLIPGGVAIVALIAVMVFRCEKGRLKLDHCRV